MVCFVMLGLSLVLGSPPATGRSAPVRAAEPMRPQREGAPDYKVVFWFDRAKPLETFQYQAYDVRKGEYTGSVDAWLKRVRRDYPRYEAYAKEIRLGRHRGATEPLRLGSAIVDEFMAVGGYFGDLDLGGTAGRGFSAPLTAAPRTLMNPAPFPTRVPGAGAYSSFSPPPYPFPNPFPYPRPHP
jgi:hypothetical protein